MNSTKPLYSRANPGLPRLSPYNGARTSLAAAAFSMLVLSLGHPSLYGQDSSSTETPSAATVKIEPKPDLTEAALSTLKTYCFDCHKGDGAEGGIKVDIFGADQKIGDHVELIEKIILALKEHQMPPADSAQPNDTERVRLLEWIEEQLQEFDCGSVSRPGRVTIRRLNRIEYDNTVRDLTGLDLKLSNDFPSDDVGNGFDNIGDVLSIPPILLEKYLNAANAIATEILKNPDALKRVFPLTAKDPQNRDEVIEVVRNNAIQFAGRAFRRPLKTEEADRLVSLMRFGWEANASKEEILQATIAAILASPYFIFRVEEDDASDFVDGVRNLNDFELATRLSYFLWSSMPDERLLQLAGEGKLHTPDQLEAEVERMLADGKSQALVKNFLGQWLQLRDLDALSPDPEKFSSFDANLRTSMRRETEMLFANILAEDRSLLELLGAEYTYVNGRLATHYGIEGVTGEEFQKVSLQGKRKGVLMHGSILLLTSNPTRTSPVKRGKWVLENLLAEPPPPPPPNAPVLDESGETLGTLRQQMEQHRVNPNCAVCHVKMDAVGFGLENFDAIGKWRDNDGPDKIDPSGILPGGRNFKGPLDLAQILVEDKKTEFTRCVTMKMLTYALGRGLNVSDRCTVNSLVEHVAQNEFRISSLVKSIVTSPPFTTQESGR
jgi:hypothetical protein